MLRAACLLLLLLCPSVFGQASASSTAVAGETQWRSTLSDLLARPAGTATLQELQRFDESVRMATPYFGTLTPGDYDANRELIRRMTAYLAAMNAISQDPRMRYALRRASQSLLLLRSTLPPALSSQLGPAPSTYGAPESRPPAPPSRAQAPYEMRAPEVPNVAEADKATARDLQLRYESAAAQAATAWQSAEILRQNLAAGGMALNTLTATSIARVQLYLANAVDALREMDWVDARVNIERAEYETEKVFRTVGR